VDYTGIQHPKWSSPWPTKGLAAGKKCWPGCRPDTLIIKAAGVTLPPTGATVQEVDFKAQKIKAQDWALASLALLARKGYRVKFDVDMLKGRAGRPVFRQG
jgi:2-oxoglutarate ferredoxin oxidoreductase subunit beta